MVFGELNVLLIIATLATIGLAVRDFKKSYFGSIFVYFLTGTIFLGSTTLLIYLQESAIISLHENTVNVGWHAIFYISLLLYLYGGKKLASTPDKNTSGGFDGSLKNSGIAFVLLFLVFASMLIFNSQIDALLTTQLWESIGLQHFAAFALAGYCSLYLLKLRKNTGSMMSPILLSLIVTFAFFSLMHFWELLTESWKVIALDNNTIEFVEQVIAFPAYVFLFYGVLKSRRIFTKMKK